MQIVIPMSGFGERFRRAGYTVPKPLIEIEGKPIIAHVVDLFPGETDIIFVCNQEHLDIPEYRMAEILQQLCPQAKIVGIAPHRQGPVHAVEQIAHLLKADEPVLVNYCDFSCYWDWQEFRAFVTGSKCDGAIPAYKGFHPHSLGTTNYAYMRETDGWVEDIQEKQPFTNTRMEEYASSGTYYFARADRMLDAFQQMKAQGLSLNGEYYVSLAYKPLLAAGDRIAVYPLQHFMQWGTPEDVAEYEHWSRTFRKLVAAKEIVPEPTGSLVVPMAGMGQRFAQEGYTTPKPLIPISGRPMVAQATHDLPASREQAFVLRADMPGYTEILAELKQLYPAMVEAVVPSVTQGQACSALLGLDALREAEGPVTFGACDNGALYDASAFRALCDDPEVDVIVWGVRGHSHAVRHPHMYGWIDADAAGSVHGISVKAPLSNPATDAIVIGTFTFKRAADFRQCLSHLMARKGLVNGEYYIDSCINDALTLGLNCRLFEIDSFLSWGTPNDVRVFEYWQSCFHKWNGHPYRLERDGRVPPTAVTALSARYSAWRPALPEAA